VHPADISRARDIGAIIEHMDYEVNGATRNGKRQFLYHLKRIEDRWPMISRFVAESYRVGLRRFKKARPADWTGACF
jgi:hypothetical protein